MSTAEKPHFIEIDPQADEKLLIGKYLELTKKQELFPAQSERILISLIAYYANLVKTEFDNAAALNLVRFSRAPILDFIGELFRCPRLKAKYGYDIQQITLFEAFASDLTIHKGLEIQTKDGKYIFKTSSDVVVKAGETVVTVPIVCETATSAVNVYGAGDINVLIKPLSYIKSVTNLNGVSGGLDDESDESYIERILLSPESYTCAGSYGSYIYHTKSAHQDIVDVEAESPQLPAEVNIDGAPFEEFEVNYKTGRLTFTHNEQSFEIIIPPAASVFVYPLVKDGGAGFDIIKNAVENKLFDKECIPMTDYINVVEPTAINKELDITILLEDDCEKDSVKTTVNSVIENLCANYRKTLNTSLVPLRVSTPLGNIEGVHDVILNNLKAEEKCKINEYFVLTAKVTFE